MIVEEIETAHLYAGISQRPTKAFVLKAVVKENKNG